jgi:hypothetical protein
MSTSSPRVVQLPSCAEANADPETINPGCCWRAFAPRPLRDPVCALVPRAGGDARGCSADMRGRSVTAAALPQSVPPALPTRAGGNRRGSPPRSEQRPDLRGSSASLVGVEDPHDIRHLGAGPGPTKATSPYRPRRPSGPPGRTGARRSDELPSCCHCAGEGELCQRVLWSRLGMARRCPIRTSQPSTTPRRLGTAWRCRCATKPQCRCTWRRRRSSACPVIKVLQAEVAALLHLCFCEALAAWTRATPQRRYG